MASSYSPSDNAHTCKGEFNIGEIEGAYIYFSLYDDATDTILRRVLKFTYSEFQTLSIFSDFDTTTNILKRWFYNKQYRHASPNIRNTDENIIQPIYKSNTEKTLTSILYSGATGKKRNGGKQIVYFVNDIKYDYSTGNYKVIPILNYNNLVNKPVSLLN